jgi:hypothetical protein
VLSGIGGETVEEAKQRVTYAEFQDWLTFRKMRGSLFIGNRLESGFGLLTYMVSRAMGGKQTLRDFMPHADKPDQPVEMDLDSTISAVMANLNAARVRK